MAGRRSQQKKGASESTCPLPRNIAGFTSHLYTLVVSPNNTYTVKIDNEIAQSGSLEEDWDFQLPHNLDLFAKWIVPCNTAL